MLELAKIGRGFPINPAIESMVWYLKYLSLKPGDENVQTHISCVADRYPLCLDSCSELFRRSAANTDSDQSDHANHGRDTDPDTGWQKALAQRQLPVAVLVPALVVPVVVAGR